MLEYILFAAGYAFTAAVSPGPLMAFLVSSVLRKGWKRTLPACFAPVVSDIPIATLVLLFLSNIPEAATRILRGAGGLFLIYLAVITFLNSRKSEDEGEQEKKKEPGTLFQAAAVNILNPNPYIGWSLVLGPAFLEAWRRGPAQGVSILVSFYATLTIMLALLIVLLGTTAFLSGKTRSFLVLLSAVVLAALGTYQAAVSVIM